MIPTAWSYTQNHHHHHVPCNSAPVWDGVPAPGRVLSPLCTYPEPPSAQAACTQTEARSWSWTQRKAAFPAPSSEAEVRRADRAWRPGVWLNPLHLWLCVAARWQVAFRPCQPGDRGSNSPSRCSRCGASNHLHQSWGWSHCELGETGRPSHTARGAAQTAFLPPGPVTPSGAGGSCLDWVDGREAVCVRPCLAAMMTTFALLRGCCRCWSGLEVHCGRSSACWRFCLCCTAWRGRCQLFWADLHPHVAPTIPRCFQLLHHQPDPWRQHPSPTPSPLPLRCGGSQALAPSSPKDCCNTKMDMYVSRCR